MEVQSHAREICKANNLGIAFLLRGDGDQAVKLFFEALYHVRELLETTKKGQRKVKEGFCVETLLEESRSSLLPLQQCREYFLFDRAVHFTLASTVTTEVAILYAASILFNLALASHVEARQGAEQALCRTQLLYSTSLQVLKKCKFEGPPFVELRLMNFNNMLQIHHELADHQSTMRCLESVRHIAFGPDMKRIGIRKTVLESILLNISMGYNSNSVARAA